MLALANLRERWSSFLAAFLAIVIGVALTSAALLIASSASPPVQPRLSGTAALAVSTQDPAQSTAPADAAPWTSAAAAEARDRLAGVPGVADAVVDRSFYAQAFPGGKPVGDPENDEAGHGWSSTKLAPAILTEGAEPRGPRDMVVDRALGVQVGSTLPVNTTAGLQDFRVTGLVDEPGFYVSDAEAELRSPGARTIGVLAAPGATPSPDALDAALGAGGSVLTGDERSAVEPIYQTHQRFVGTQMIGAITLLGLFTTVFVVSSTLALAIAQRRRELGLLRTVGAAPRQIRLMVVGETLGLGLGGGIVGCIAGIGLAPVLQSILTGLEAAPPDLQLSITPGPLLGATAVGVLVAMIGAGLASRTAARVRPLEALQDGAVERTGIGRGRAVAGTAALVVAALLVITTVAVGAESRQGMALGAAMALIAAAALLSPLVIGPVVREVTAPTTRRSSSAITMLVRAEVLAATRRAAATAAPIIAAVGFAVLISGMIESMAAAYPASQAEQAAGQVIVYKDGTPGFGDQVVQQTGTPPGTRAPLPTTVYVDRGGGQSVVVEGVGQLGDTIPIGPDQVVLSEQMAATLQTGQGRTLPVTFADGTTHQLRVSQVLPLDPTRGDFSVSRDTARAHDPDALTTSVFIPADRAPTTDLPGAAVHDGLSFATLDYEADARLTEGLAMLMVVISAGYSGLAVANSMAMAAHGRRGDFAVLRSAGGTTKQLLSVAVGETALVGIIGAVLGVVVTVPPLLAMASGLSEATATDVGLQLDWGTVFGVSAGCLVLALGSSLLVTWRSAARADLT